MYGYVWHIYRLYLFTSMDGCLLSGGSNVEWAHIHGVFGLKPSPFLAPFRPSLSAVAPDVGPRPDQGWGDPSSDGVRAVRRKKIG